MPSPYLYDTQLVYFKLYLYYKMNLLYDLTLLRTTVLHIQIFLFCAEDPQPFQEEKYDDKLLEYAVELSNINASWLPLDPNKNVLKSIDILIKPGSLVGIIGPNGSGKVSNIVWYFLY